MSAFFSATETAFTSFNAVRMKNASSAGNKRSGLVLKLAEDYDRLLTTILIGNNIVNITAASIGTVIFTRSLGDLGVTVSTVVVTLLVLTFGEIFPKTFAKEAADQFAMFAVPFMRVLIVLFAPLSRFYAWAKDILSRRFSLAQEQGITEAELLTIVDEARSEGGIRQQEGELIRSIFQFDDLEAEDIITPRVDVVAVPRDASTDEILGLFRQTGFSRLPVYQSSIDEVVGIINQKDFHNEVVQNNATLASIVQPAIYVTSSTKLNALMSHLQQRKSHLAVVVDEYGGTLGIVTMEDIIEELVGEIWDEHDQIVEDIKQRTDNEYRVLASAHLEKVFRELDFYDEETEAVTVGGWVVEKLGRISQEGDEFEFENLSVTISKTSSRRVLEIIIQINKQISDKD
jgi:CBS domain containing-hemolysin-like protein